MSATTDFVAAQNQNRRNTMVLLAALTLLAGGIGYLVGALMEGESSGSLERHLAGGRRQDGAVHGRRQGDR